MTTPRPADYTCRLAYLPSAICTSATALGEILDSAQLITGTDNRGGNFIVAIANSAGNKTCTVIYSAMDGAKMNIAIRGIILLGTTSA